MCLYPKLILNRKYVANKKNGGYIPPIVDERSKYVPVGCQNCIECRKQKAREWQVRLLEDLKQHSNGKFITLTFSDEAILKLCDHKKLFEVDQKKKKKAAKSKYKYIVDKLEGYEKDNEIATVAVRLFLERWRKKYKKSLRHWLVTELGHNGTENIHLHGIVWTDTNLDDLEQIWSYGYVWKGKKVNDKIINYVNESTVNYITKYVTKIDKLHKTYKPRILTSAGIGSSYTTSMNSRNNKFNGKDTNEAYKTRQGYKVALPVYWRNKLYTDDEREKLWLHKLDKEVRFVKGIKIDVSKGDQIYYQVLETAREENKNLGYGNDKIDWNREVYERERRKIIQETRLQRARNKGNTLE